MMCLYVDGCFFLYISGRVTVPGEFLPFTPFVFFTHVLCTGPPLIPVLITPYTSYDTSAYLNMMMIILMMLTMMMMMLMMMMIIIILLPNI